MAGINRAYLAKSFMKMEAAAKTKKACIFLSHISIDKNIAQNIGNYIMQNGDLDIYLDIYDEELQQAAAKGDPFKVTELIEKGISESSHVMCLVSENTVKSWWVPYELGFGKNGRKEISTLTLKNTVTLPDFLKIGKILRGTKSLNVYLEEICNATRKSLLQESSYANLVAAATAPHPLDNYLDWQS